MRRQKLPARGDHKQKRPPTAYLSKQPTGVNDASIRATTSFSGTKGSDQQRGSREFSKLSASTKKVSSGTTQLLSSDSGLLVFEAIPIAYKSKLSAL